MPAGSKKTAKMEKTTQASSEGVPTPGPTAWLLRMQLRDVQPVIWREVWVDPDITLRKLHQILQAAMGWQDCHLYGFGIPGSGRTARYWGIPPQRRFEPRLPDGGFDMGEPARDDARTRLRQVMAARGDKLLYLYDYGDDWEHLLTLKKIAVVAEPLPMLVAGGGDCPPEDCGGVGGFMDLVEILQDPEHPEHIPMREWTDEVMGTGWMPGDLDAASFGQLTAAVARLRPRGKARQKGT